MKGNPEGGFKDGWRYFWNITKADRFTFFLGFWAALVLVDTISEALADLVRWLL